ncbi:MAG TPA: hypothetical protein VN549_05315 [Negativicutes bacterium]|nr:hypothetical protein [Negativicutes bacterium]
MIKIKDCIVSISDKDKGIFAVEGHAGIGHAHSHSSFVQDDSAGFAVVASLMKEALEVDTRIKRAVGDPVTGAVTVETYGGGTGSTFSRRGITPFEAEIISGIKGEDGIYTQAAAMKAFGRIYGQGAMETPVALQGAIALAVLDSFHKKASGKVYTTVRKYQGRIDKMAAAVVDVDGIPVSLLLNINGSEGGIGPDEDNEGNTALGEKAEIMDRVGFNDVPAVIVESKAYSPAVSDGIQWPTFVIRAQEGIDNLPLAKVLAASAQMLELPYVLLTDALPQVKGQLAGATAAFADKVAGLAENLKKAETSMDKVEIVAQLARLISEDAGGISFMSNGLHEVARGAGIVPGKAAVLSLFVPKSYRDHWKIPVVSAEDIEQYRKIILYAMGSSL